MLHPSAKVVVLEADDAIGGVWAQGRVYPGLKSNNVCGSLEYPDFPMDESYGIKAGEHIPGTVIYAYLTDCARKSGVLERTRLRTRVESAEDKGEQGWLLTTLSGDGRAKILAARLIVTTGMTSDPSMPAFEGVETFTSTLFHSRDFHKHADTLNTAKSVVVIGGAKSAWDISYAYALAGVEAHMVIRESGHGPIWMAPPRATPLKALVEHLTLMRVLSWLSPCIWGDADGFAFVRRLLHATRLGRFFVDGFWKLLAGDVRTLMKYDDHLETAKLGPWTNPFFLGNGLSILNYDTDFLGLVRAGKIQIHVADVTRLAGDAVCLTDGTRLPVDVLVYATGWKHAPPLQFLPEGTAAALGLPHHVADPEPTPLELRADAEILAKFPRLAAQPSPKPKAMRFPKTPLADPAAPVAPNKPVRAAPLHDPTLANAATHTGVCVGAADDKHGIHNDRAGVVDIGLFRRGVEP